MLANPKAKVARRREVLFPQLVFLDLKTTFENFLGFGAANCDVDGDFLVTSDAECAYGVAGFACGERGRLGIGGSFLVGIGRKRGKWKVRTVDRCLTTELFEHFGRTGKSVARFADGDVEDKFLYSELAHGVRALVLL